MKKRILLYLISISVPFMGFHGCSGAFYWIAYIISGLITCALTGNTFYGDRNVQTNYSIYAGQNGIIFRASGDKNLIFEQKNSGTTQNLNNARISPSFFYTQVVAVGNNGTVVYSLNTGNNWSSANNVTGSNLYGVDFSSSGTEFYAVGDNGTIIYSPVIPSNWQLRNSGTLRNLKSVALSGNFATRVVAVGEKGTILRTTNAGITWQNVSIADTTVNFYSVSRKNPFHTVDFFIIAGSGGRIYKSTDFGASWIQKASGTTNTLRDIYMLNNDSGIVVGDNGTIRVTTNGGEFWFSDPYFNSPPNRNYKNASLLNNEKRTYMAFSDTVFFLSEDTITVGLQNTGSQIPKNSNLSQNYPNPFNPSTKIKFEIPKSNNPKDNVKLIIHNSLGEQVAVLVDEKLNAGTYEYEFKGEDLPSGIYFYTLKTNNFNETKKMIILK